MPQQLLDDIQAILQKIKDDQRLLEKIAHFMQTSILPKIEAEEPVSALPEKYEKVAIEIARSLQSGSLRITCYLNRDTLEIEELPEDYENYDWYGDTDKEGNPLPRHKSWERYLAFEPLSSQDSYQIMADFAEQLDDTNVQNLLFDILNRPKPFSHFNNFIHNSDYRRQWFDFQNMAYEKHVKRIIRVSLGGNEAQK